jgi:glycine cleavage system H protein
MAVPNDRRYTNSHEWVKDNGDGTFTVGVTEHAQGELGDLVFVELPGVGDSFDKGAAAVVLESVKAAADVYCPCAGLITAVNAELAEHPERVNDDAQGEGWMYTFKPAGSFNHGALLDAAAYEALLG